MKGMKFIAAGLCALLMFSSCSLNNTAKGSLIGVGGGAAVGAGIGALIGKGKGAVIGAAIGTAVGGGVGAFVGHKMDKAKAEAEKIANAQVESVTDANGLAAVKVTFESGILFKTSSSTLSNTAKSSLSQFATNVLKQNPDMDVAIQGYTDNTGWKNSTVAQSQQKNKELSLQRAQSVETYLKSCGVSDTQIKTVLGYGEENPVADNTTAAGKEQNRRVEVYIYASQQMIEAAQTQAN